MSPEGEILLWWLLFAGTHVVGSSAPVRERVTGAIGVPPFKGVYSLVAFATFIPLCYVYGNNKHAGAVLFTQSPGLDLLAQAIMLLAFVVIGQGAVTPNPLSTAVEMAGKPPADARGIQRITRHPINFAFALFGIAHCLSNPHVGDWIFFGGFVVFAAVSAVHQDARVLATRADACARFHGETSLLPFGAILAGKQRLALAEFSGAGLGVGVGLFVLLRVFHGSLLGGFGA